ncbi:MAG: NuoI/complex I 23 kDa subunit family protein [Nitrospinota bacterium]
MAINVKRIERAAELTLLERVYIVEVLRGLGITMRRFFYNFKHLFGEFILRRGRASRSIMTVMYPEETLPFPAAFRGRPVLIVGSDGNDRCVACGLCEAACPPLCINIKGGMRDDGSYYPLKYTLDGGKCIFCGRCEEVCPKRAIVMSHECKDISVYDRENLVYEKEDLSRTVKQVTPRLFFIQNNSFSKKRYPSLEDQNG